MTSENPLAPLEAVLTYSFKNKALLQQALTHRTWLEEQSPGARGLNYQSQQRLEFFGAALLNYTVAKWLYSKIPLADDGELTDRRKQFAKSSWLHDRGEKLVCWSF